MMERNTVEATASPGRRLREAWTAQPIAVPGVFSALVARMAHRLGYQAIYLSGAALSATAGVPPVPDLDHFPLLGFTVADGVAFLQKLVSQPGSLG